MVLVGRAWFRIGLREMRMPGQTGQTGRVVPAGGKKPGTTIADWLETWVETRARLRDSTRRIYRGHIRQHLRRLFDGVLLSELHVGHVGMAFRRLFDEGRPRPRRGGCSPRCGRR
jgi:hypothetical protein